MKTQMTLRKIPTEVEKKLRARALQSKRSLNRTTLDLLEQALGLQSSNERNRDLSRLAGKWDRESCEEFERNTRIFEQIDPELWSQ